ncbi:MAG: hypothetical protein ACXWQR_22195 [Ktedonobacterales bacterium]
MAQIRLSNPWRQLIDRISGTPPEDLPPEPSIRPLIGKHARQQKKLSPDNTESAPALFDTLPDSGQQN